MPSGIICHNKGRYNFYSTISDGFRFVESINLKQLQDLIKEEDGTNGLKKLPERLERSHDQGTSMFDMNLKELLEENRAGEDEKHLSYEECIKTFLS
jgi:hypothetical protein